MLYLLLLGLIAGCQVRSPERAAQPARTAAPLRIVALGDSFTIGTGSPEEAAFPARLGARLQAAGRPVTIENLARNGYTTQDLLDEELPQVGAAPDLVTLAIGANDLVRWLGSEPARGLGRGLDRGVGQAEEAAYRAQLRRIFAALGARGVPGARVVTLPQPDWSLGPAAAAFGAPAEIGRRIERYNAILAEEAARAGARHVDLFSLMRRQARAGRFAADGLHPAASAYDEWAAALLDALRARFAGEG